VSKTVLLAIYLLTFLACDNSPTAVINSNEGTVTIKTNHAISFEPENAEGTMIIRFSYNGVQHAAHIAYSTTLGGVIILSSTGDIEVLDNTELQGTTGNNNVVTVSAVISNGLLYIENQLGGTVTIKYH
jgi:hypothetical protein